MIMLMTMKAIVTQHPRHPPALRCLPDFVKGIPVFLEIFDFIPEMPVARFHENEKPNFFAIGCLLSDNMRYAVFIEVDYISIMLIGQLKSGISYGHEDIHGGRGVASYGI